jgi:internalin A
MPGSQTSASSQICKDLYLYGTPVTDAGLAHLRELTNLQTLGLNGTQVTDAGLANLRGLTNLSELSLNGTK